MMDRIVKWIRVVGWIHALVAAGSCIHSQLSEASYAPQNHGASVTIPVGLF